MTNKETIDILDKLIIDLNVKIANEVLQKKVERYEKALSSISYKPFLTVHDMIKIARNALHDENQIKIEN